MKKLLSFLVVLAMALSLAGCGTSSDSGDDSGDEGEKITVGYISPGSDTWYLRAEEGAKWAAEKAGADFVSVNSNRDLEQEQTNIDQLINQGVDMIVILSWNEAGCVSAAEKCQAAGIECIVFDACGVMANHDVDITASVDFDWAGMGKIYADWMNENYPGEKFVFINGTMDSVVCQTLESALKTETEAIGSNELADVRYGQYNPETAANEAEDLVNSGLDFSIIGVINEDCAAAVITRLQDLGVADQYHVFAQNGSETGIQLLKNGTLEFTISSSPGLEAAIATFAGIDYKQNGGELNQYIECPIASATTENADDPYAVIPWTVNEEVWTNIINDSFPQYAGYLE